MFLQLSHDADFCSKPGAKCQRVRELENVGLNDKRARFFFSLAL